MPCYLKINKQLAIKLFNAVEEIISQRYVSKEFLNNHLQRIEFNLYAIINLNKNEQANSICKLVISVCYFYENDSKFPHLNMFLKIIDLVFTNNLLMNKSKSIFDLNIYTSKAFSRLYFECIQRDSYKSYLIILLDFFITSIVHVRAVEWFQITISFYLSIFKELNSQLEGLIVFFFFLKYKYYYFT